ncbi:MAG TPA: DUF5320 family protein [Methanoregulaceae archaeon]|nr:DUF5320 family protein [Methanoregulaceae archaeon]HPD76256.1 DUF5320 family protein [Methanoregulaceae archaeon]
MPNYDGTGPLKRGRLIGRGRGPCRQSPGVCTRKTPDEKPLIESGVPEG